MAEQDVYKVEITRISLSTGTASVSLESTVDEGTNWVVEETYAVTTTEQNFVTVIDKTGVDGLRLTYAGGLSATLSIFSMIAYEFIDVHTEVKSVPFVFNLEQKYVLILKNNVIDVYQNDVLQDTVTATGLDSELFETLKYTQAEDTMIFTHPDLETKQLVRSFASQAYTNDPSSGSDIVLNMASTSIFTVGNVVTVSSSAGSENATITALVTDTSITVDSLSLDHTTSDPLVTSTTVADWTFEDFPFENIPKASFNGETTTQPAQTLTPSAVEGSVTLTAGGSVFSAASVGQLIDAGQNGGGRVRITSYQSGTVVQGYTIIPFYTTGTIASGDWDYITGYEDVWSAIRGWPTTCMFYEQALWLAGAKNKPNTIYKSRIGQYNNFENAGNYDNDAINQTISSAQIDEIVNIYANRGIQVFTAGAEWTIPEGATTPNTFSIVKNTSNGSLDTVAPVDVAGTTMFIEKNGKSLLSFVYTEAQNAYQTSSLSLLTDIIQDPVAMAVDYNSSQDIGNFLYMVMADGTMGVWGVDFGQNIISPVRWITGNSGSIKDVINVAGDTYMLVVRNGSSYLEKIENTKTDFTTIDTSLSATISGLEAYNSTTIHAYTDTVDYGDFEVVSGAITLPSTPTEAVSIGYDFSYLLTSNKIQVGSQTENKEKRISKATVVTKDTPQLTFTGQTMSQTDDVYDFYGLTSWARDCRYSISGTFDPVEILSILLNINYGDK